MDEGKSVAIADQLKGKQSTLPQREATSQELDWYKELIGNQLRTIELKAEQTLVELKLKGLMGDSAGIAGLIYVSFVPPKMELDKAEFEKAYPELFSRYLMPQPDKISGSFSVKGKPTKRDIPEQLAKAIKDMERTVAAVEIDPDKQALQEISDDARELYTGFLERKSEIVQLSLKADVIEARLKEACGQHIGIDGICNWERVLKPQKPKLDISALKSEKSELYELFLTERASTTRVSLRPYRVLVGASG